MIISPTVVDVSYLSQITYICGDSSSRFISGHTSITSTCVLPGHWDEQPSDCHGKFYTANANAI